MKTMPSKAAGKPGDKECTTPISLRDVQDRIVCVRGVSVLLDADVAALYGVETKRVNEAVRNNPGKFPDNYMFVLTKEETVALRSKFSTAKPSPKSRVPPKAFTEKGLYMLATILKSRLAIEATFAIIETFAQVRALKRGLVDLHKEPDKRKQVEKMHRFGELLADVVMPDPDSVETEPTLELNFLIGKLKHTVRRIKRRPEAAVTSDE
jgi:hypothetical protein